jgi:hypothetical protein
MKNPGEDTMNSLSGYIRNIFGGSGYDMIEVKSTVDGRSYKVRKLPDSQEAANLLAKLRIRLQTLMDILEQKYPSKPQVIRLKKNFVPDPRRFLESTPDAKHTSYSVNKGESVHFCLRQRNGNEQLVDENVMTFVALHEMAHMATESIGHDADFWNNFAWLLARAEENNLYKYTDFKAHPVLYCGVTITDSPKYDPAKDNEKKDANDFTVGKMFSF